MPEQNITAIMCHDCGEEKWADVHAAEHPEFCIFVEPPPDVAYPDDHSAFCERTCDHPCHDAYDRWAERYGRGRKNGSYSTEEKD